jgi:hypothetical protein
MGLGVDKSIAYLGNLFATLLDVRVARPTKPAITIF